MRAGPAHLAPVTGGACGATGERRRTSRRRSTGAGAPAVLLEAVEHQPGGAPPRPGRWCAGGLFDLRPREERRRAELDGDVGHDPALGHDRLGRLRRQAGEVAPARHGRSSRRRSPPGSGTGGRGAHPPPGRRRRRPSTFQVGPDGGPEPAGQLVVVRVGQLGDGRDPQLGQPIGRRPPIPVGDRPVPIVGSHVAHVRRAHAPGLAKPVAVFACSLVSPIPTAHLSPVSAWTAAAPTGPAPRGRR